MSIFSRPAVSPQGPKLPPLPTGLALTCLGMTGCVAPGDVYAGVVVSTFLAAGWYLRRSDFFAKSPKEVYRDLTDPLGFLRPHHQKILRILSVHVEVNQLQIQDNLKQRFSLLIDAYTLSRWVSKLELTGLIEGGLRPGEGMKVYRLTAQGRDANRRPI